MEQQQRGSLAGLSSVGFLKRSWFRAGQQTLECANLKRHTTGGLVTQHNAQDLWSGVRSPSSWLAATQPPSPRLQQSAPRSLSMHCGALLFSQRQVAMYSTSEAKPPPSMNEILSKAAKRALGGGIPGMVAMVIQVFALMWMRTTINYQYRHGGTMFGTLKKLYAEGGIPRFYRGLLPALIQGPLSRFGDTAANAGMLAFLENFESTKDLPIWMKTMGASGGAALFRIALMPVDALKTTLQVEGAAGMSVLGNKIRVGGPFVLWHGALAASGATFVGHYPWFVTRNYMEGSGLADEAKLMQELIPVYDDLPRKLLRAACIGFVASAVSDTCSNSIRVIKTTKQTSKEAISYSQALTMVIAKDGITGLMFRGLGTKILSNGMQGLLFNVLWRMGMDYYAKLEKEAEAKNRK